MVATLYSFHYKYKLYDFPDVRQIIAAQGVDAYGVHKRKSHRKADGRT